MTTDTTGLAGLIERLEKGSGEDRELDAVLGAMTVRAKYDLSHTDAVIASYDRLGDWPHSTTSIDDALSFAEVMLPEMNCHGYDKTPTSIEAYVSRNNVGFGHWYVSGEHRESIARAVLIATLRALAKDTTDAE